jgi:nucleoside-diphosphate-sugar epimerase
MTTSFEVSIMRYFVTGSTGFIGGRLTEKLLERGDEVSALVRDLEKGRKLKEIGAEIFKGDITMKDTLKDPMEGVDGVFHTAAIYRLGVNNAEKLEKVNVEGTRNVLMTMKELSVPKGVYTSSLSINSNTHGEMVTEGYLFRGKHISAYARTKWEAHHSIAVPMIRNQGLPLVIVLPGAVYGPGDTSQLGEVFTDYLRGKIPFLPKEPEYCWGHIDDVVRGHILAMERGREGETYIIGGPRHSMVEAFRIAEKVTGVKAPRIRVSGRTMRFFASITGFFNTFMNVPSRYHPESLRETSSATLIGSSEKARKQLGWEARPLEQGFRETLIPRMEEMGIG